MSPGFGFEQRCEDLAVGVQDAGQIRVREGAGTVGVEEASLLGLTRGELTVDLFLGHLPNRAGDQYGELLQR